MVKTFFDGFVLMSIKNLKVIVPVVFFDVSSTMKNGKLNVNKELVEKYK